MASTYCEVPECLESSDCPAGHICAPVWLDQPTGNHQETFEGVRCVPDPASCVAE